MSTQYKSKPVYAVTLSVKCDGCGYERCHTDLYSFAEFCSYFDISTKKVINSMHSCSPLCYKKVQEMARIATAKSIQTQLLNGINR